MKKIIVILLSLVLTGCNLLGHEVKVNIPTNGCNHSPCVTQPVQRDIIEIH